jgi:4-hydroxybenzoate polyprenyltransferase
MYVPVNADMCPKIIKLNTQAHRIQTLPMALHIACRSIVGVYVDNCLFLYSYTLRNFTFSKTCTHAGTQDKRDDMTVGVRSTALLLGVRGTRTAGAAFAAAQAALLCAAGSAAGVGPAFYAGVMAGAAHQTWQLSTAKLNDPADCMAKFVSNKWYGALIYAGIIGNQLL